MTHGIVPDPAAPPSTGYTVACPTTDDRRGMLPMTAPATVRTARVSAPAPGRASATPAASSPSSAATALRIQADPGRVAYSAHPPAVTAPVVSRAGAVTQSRAKVAGARRNTSPSPTATASPRSAGASRTAAAAVRTRAARPNCHPSGPAALASTAGYRSRAAYHGGDAARNGAVIASKP